MKQHPQLFSEVTNQLGRDSFVEMHTPARTYGTVKDNHTKGEKRIDITFTPTWLLVAKAYSQLGVV